MPRLINKYEINKCKFFYSSILIENSTFGLSTSISLRDYGWRSMPIINAHANVHLRVLSSINLESLEAIRRM